MNLCGQGLVTFKIAAEVELELSTNGIAILRCSILFIVSCFPAVCNLSNFGNDSERAHLSCSSAGLTSVHKWISFLNSLPAR